MSKNGTYLKKCIVCDTTRVVYLSSAWIGGMVTSRLVGMTFSDTPQYRLNWYSLVCVQTIFISLYNILYIVVESHNRKLKERVETESVNSDN